MTDKTYYFERIVTRTETYKVSASSALTALEVLEDSEAVPHVFLHSVVTNEMTDYIQVPDGVRNEDAPPYESERPPQPAPSIYERFTHEEIVEAALTLLREKVYRGPTMLSAPVASDYLKVRLAGRPNEHFGAIWLDQKHRVIADAEYFEGTIDSCTVNLRTLIRAAMEHNAARAILFHNHPSGSCEPSQADIQITRKIKEALGYFDVTVLDHLVIGGDDHVSLAERGLI